MNDGMDISKVTSSFDWPGQMKELRVLDSLLRCQICRSYFETCMTTSCSHNFCSRCVRNSMTVEAKCPLCFKETAEPSLRKNILMDEIVQVFQQLRNNHLETLKKLVSAPYSSEVPTEMHAIPGNANVKVKSGLRKNATVETVDISDDICIIEQIKPEDNVNPCVNQNSDRLSSPSSCSSGTGGTNNLSMNRASGNSYLPKTVYNLMTVGKLKNKLKEHGLSTKGDKKTLVVRHQRFIAMYNANCDSSSPKPDSEILKELEQEEQAIDKGKSNELATLTRNTPQEVIDVELAQYRKRHKVRYDELIRKVKSRTDNENV